MGGCSLHHDEAALPLLSAQPTVELEQVPFISQQKYQCGPAALATVLVYNDVAVTAEQLVSQVYLPKRKGTLQAEILATARHYEQIPYTLDPHLERIVEELQQGRPVLVLLDVGFAFWKAYHYAVVIGYTEDELLLRSGKSKRLAVPLDQFLKSWQGAGKWAVILLQPGDLPAHLDQQRFLAAVAAMESGGKIKAAVDSYQALVERDPEYGDARFGLANSYLQLGQLALAREHYLRLLEQQPNHLGAVNNLAETYRAMECPWAGVTLLEQFLARNRENMPEGTKFLEATLEELYTASREESNLTEPLEGCPEAQKR